MIIEYRKEFEQIQLNYCYEGSTKDEIFKPSFTQKELDNWFELNRVTYTEAIQLLSGDNPTTYDWKFIQIRALEILNHINDKSKRLQRKPSEI